MPKTIKIVKKIGKNTEVHNYENSIQNSSTLWRMNFIPDLFRESGHGRQTQGVLWTFIDSVKVQEDFKCLKYNLPQASIVFVHSNVSLLIVPSLPLMSSSTAVVEPLCITCFTFITNSVI